MRPSLPETFVPSLLHRDQLPRPLELFGLLAGVLLGDGAAATQQAGNQDRRDAPLHGVPPQGRDLTPGYRTGRPRSTKTAVRAVNGGGRIGPTGAPAGLFVTGGIGRGTMPITPVFTRPERNMIRRAEVAAVALILLVVGSLVAVFVAV